MHLLVYLYNTQPMYWTSTFGQNHAYCIRIFTVVNFGERDLSDNVDMLSVERCCTDAGDYAQAADRPRGEG